MGLVLSPEEEDRRMSVSMRCSRGTAMGVPSVKAAVCKPGRGPFPGTEYSGTSVLDLSSPRTVGNKFLLLKLARLLVLLEQPEQTKAARYPCKDSICINWQTLSLSTSSQSLLSLLLDEAPTLAPVFEEPAQPSLNKNPTKPVWWESLPTITVGWPFMSDQISHPQHLVSDCVGRPSAGAPLSWCGKNPPTLSISFFY